MSADFIKQNAQPHQPLPENGQEVANEFAPIVNPLQEQYLGIISSPEDASTAFMEAESSNKISNQTEIQQQEAEEAEEDIEDADTEIDRAEDLLASLSRMSDYSFYGENANLDQDSSKLLAEAERLTDAGDLSDAELVERTRDSIQSEQQRLLYSRGAQQLDNA